MTDTVKTQRWSNRNRVRILPVAAAAFAAPALMRHTTRAQQAEVRITGYTSSTEEQTLFEQILGDAQTALPDIKIKYEPIPSDYATKLQTDIAAGSVADVFYLDSLAAPDFMVNNALLDLTGYMGEAGVKPEDFYPGLIGAFQSGGKTYGLPKDWSSLGMIYNADKVTTVPTTWEELRAAAQTLADDAGEPRINIPSDIARYFAFHYAAGAKVISDDGTAIVIDSPEANTALEFYYGLYRDGLASTPADAGAEWPGDALAKGYADIVFEGNWVFPFLKANAPDLNFGIAEMPAGPAGKATLAFTVSFSAYAGTKVPEQSWSLINYLTGPEGMGKWVSLGLAMPSRVGLADAWAAQFPERQPFLTSGDYARGWQLGPGGQAFLGDANAEMQGLFAETQDVATTLQKMQSEAEARIQLTGVAAPASTPTS